MMIGWITLESFLRSTTLLVLFYMPYHECPYKHCGVRQWSALGHPIRGNVHNRRLSESQQKQFKSMELS